VNYVFLWLQLAGQITSDRGVLLFVNTNQMISVNSAWYVTHYK